MTPDNRIGISPKLSLTELPNRYKPKNLASIMLMAASNPPTTMENVLTLLDSLNKKNLLLV